MGSVWSLNYGCFVAGEEVVNTRLVRTPTLEGSCYLSACTVCTTVKAESNVLSRGKTLKVHSGYKINNLDEMIHQSAPTQCRGAPLITIPFCLFKKIAGMRVILFLVIIKTGIHILQNMLPLRWASLLHWVFKFRDGLSRHTDVPLIWENGNEPREKTRGHL